MLELQALAGNRAVAELVRPRPVAIQRLKENAANRAAITSLKQAYLRARANDFAGWTGMLAAAGNVEDLRQRVDAVQPAAAAGGPPPAAAREEPSDEQLAANVKSTDMGREIGPFNGGDGHIGPAHGTVYFDAKRKYAIGRDDSGHAGEAWKLFIKNSKGWQRLDTLAMDGTRMNRG